MKYINVIILIFILAGCRNNMIINQKDKEVIKFFLPVVYNSHYTDYKMGYFYQYNREYAKENKLKKFNFKELAKNCLDVEWSIAKVYYKNIDNYRNNIPYKHEHFCGDDLVPESTMFFDSEGKVTKIEYPKKIVNFTYTNNSKIEKTIDKKTNKLEVIKYIYNKRLELKNTIVLK